jgi:hypothetical protein
MPKPNAYSHIAQRLEESLDTIRILAEVLVANGGCKGNPDEPAQIDDRGESGIQRAILLIAQASHSEFCRLATDLGIPE